MLKNYLKTAIRNILKQKITSVINILGLSIGIASIIMIVMWVQDEFKYDKNYHNFDRIYRVLDIDPVIQSADAEAPYQLGEFINSDIPEVASMCRFYNIWGSSTISYKDKTFSENRFLYTDSTVLQVFNYEFLYGDPKTAFKEPNSIIITRTAAKKYFGNTNPVGKLLTLDHTYHLKITGLIEDVPEQSHFTFDFLVYLPDRLNYWFKTNWGIRAFKTYVLLTKNGQADHVVEKIPEIIKRHLGQEASQENKFDLQPLSKIYLHSSHVKSGLGKKGNITLIYMLLFIAFLLLLIACFNYINLSSARSILRAKEVGLRKTIGANRLQLIFQFMGESLLITFFALLLATLLIEIILPAFNNFFDKKLVNFYSDGIFTLYVILSTLIIGIFSAGYPALLLSSMRTIQILQGKGSLPTKTLNTRKGLVIFQFTVTIILIIATISVYLQLHYMKTKDLGFNKNQLMAINISNKSVSNDVLKNTFLEIPNVTGVSIASSVPPNSYHFSDCHLPGNDKKSITIKNFIIDYDYIDLLEMQIADGRNFSKKFSTDLKQAFVINESAVKELNLTNPVGQQIHTGWANKTGTIIGVVKDFHFKSLRVKIEPAIFQINPDQHNYTMIVKVQPGDIQNTIQSIHNTWKELNAEWPFIYSFIDESFERFYVTEQKMILLIGLFSLLSIFVACLGLLGLSLFIIERRIKEISIRKVLGASVLRIFTMVNMDFIKWLVVANVFAWPIGWYAMNKWLQNFAYRVDITIWTFLAAGLLVLVVALFTVSWQAIRAAQTNPVEALKYE